MIPDRRGLLIVFEGLDRAGKTTQAKLLKNYFERCHEAVSLINFPVRTTEIGKQIDMYLKGEVEYTHEQVHELFSKNRWELKDQMTKNLESGINIILDRYAYSGVAYSIAKARFFLICTLHIKGLEADWCKKDDEGLPEPDLIFYLDISPEDAAQRNGYGHELFERKEFQSKVKESYKYLIDDEWIIISATQDQEKIHQDVIDYINQAKKKSLNKNSIRKLWPKKNLACNARCEY